MHLHKACHKRNRAERDRHGPCPQSIYNFFMASRGIQQISRDSKDTQNFLWFGIYIPLASFFCARNWAYVQIANFKSTRLWSRVHNGKVGMTQMDKSCRYQETWIQFQIPRKRWMYTKRLSSAQAYTKCSFKKIIIVKTSIEHFLGNNKNGCIAWFYLSNLYGYWH